MKILYFVNHPISKDDGVVKKVKSQINYFEKNGATAGLLAFTEDGISSNIVEAFVVKTSAFKSRLLPYYAAIKYVYDFKPDIIYARYDTFILTQLIIKLFFRIPIVFEINTYDLSEARLLYKKTKSLKEIIKYVVYWCTRKIWLNRVANGLVFVTNDLKLKYRGIVAESKPVIAIPNSINISLFGHLNMPLIDNKELLFIGTPNQPWHGIDKLLNLAESLPEFKFHIVGSEGLTCDNVIYHGYRSFEEYISIYEKCFACVGPLAIDRYNLRESSPLKVREYIALNKPVIFAYKDFPLSEVCSSNFLRLEEIEDAWADQIRRFYNDRENMRAYDKEVLAVVDSNIVEKRRYDFLLSII